MLGAVVSGSQVRLFMLQFWLAWWKRNGVTGAGQIKVLKHRDFIRGNIIRTLLNAYRQPISHTIYAYHWSSNAL